MKIFNKDWLINLQKTILWQYDNSQKLSDIIINKEIWYKTNVTDFIVDFFWNIFNLKTANDFGLNVWGKILNFPRQIVITYGANAGQVYNLSKEQYRFLLIGQVLKFQMNCTIPEINKYLNVIFPDSEGACYVVDNKDMSIIYILSQGFMTDEIKMLVDNYEFLPRPAGVKITVYTSEIFVYRLEVISEGFPTTNLPSGVRVSFTKNGETVEPRIRDNGYEVLLQYETDVLNWEIKYVNSYFPTVIDSGTNITITQNTTQYGYATRRLQIQSTPNVPIKLKATSHNYYTWIRYVENGVVTEYNGEKTFQNGVDVYVLSHSSIHWIISGNEGYGNREGNIESISEDKDLKIHLLPYEMKIKSTDVATNKNIPLFDVYETTVDETGTYNVILKGEQGGIKNNSSSGEINAIRYTTMGTSGTAIESAGGILSFDISLTENDNIKIKRINGGYCDTQDYLLFYVGGSGVAIWINNELIAVVGGGANGGAVQSDTYYSAGGGGYNGGKSVYQGTGAGQSDSVYWAGFSIDGTRGDSTVENQNACGSNAYLNSSTRTNGYGGSSFIKNNDSRISNIVQVYGGRQNNENWGNISQGNREEGKITVIKNA